MHTVPRKQLPEPRERRTFPFGGTPLPSPAPSCCSSSSARWHTTTKDEKPEIPYILTHAGIEIIGEPGPASQNVPSKSFVPKLMRQKYKHHLYNAYNNFGHWNVANNVNSWLAHENLPKWSTSNNSYGVHYYHPHQKFAKGFKNRMPVYQYEDSRRFLYFPEKEAEKKLY